MLNYIEVLDYLFVGWIVGCLTIAIPILFTKSLTLTSQKQVETEDNGLHDINRSIS